MKDGIANGVVKASISLEPEVFTRGKAVAREVGYMFSFSAYVNDLIKKDIQCRVASSRPQLASIGTS